MPDEIGMPMVKNHFVHALSPDQEELIINCIDAEIALWNGHTDKPTNYIKRLETIKTEMGNHANLSYRSL